MFPTPTLNIQAILFDADGVIQRSAPRRRAAWQELLGREEDIDDFIAAVFEIERPALNGSSDFISALASLLTARCAQGTLDDALAAWTMIEPDEAMIQLVRTLQRSGVQCSLATNQEPHRASYMSGQLGYNGLFDHEFYSCRMGVAKPEHAYFAYIVDRLGLPPADVLFLDDNEANVYSARHVGLNAVQFVVDAGPEHLVQSLEEFGICVD